MQFVFLRTIVLNKVWLVKHAQNRSFGLYVKLTFFFDRLEGEIRVHQNIRQQGVVFRLNLVKAKHLYQLSPCNRTVSIQSRVLFELFLKLLKADDRHKVLDFLLSFYGFLWTSTFATAAKDITHV